MTKIKQIYKCKICGNIVEVLHAGAGQLVCCGQPMELQLEKNKEEGLEKHLPVVEKTDTGIKIKVGEIPHPMEEAHFIQWIEVNFNGQSYKKFLKPNDKPEAEFNFSVKDLSQIKVRQYCNLHGLWQK